MLEYQLTLLGLLGAGGALRADLDRECEFVGSTLEIISFVRSSSEIIFNIIVRIINLRFMEKVTKQFLRRNH